MKRHTKNFIKYYGIYPDEIFCAVCQRKATDLHHIKSRGMGGASKDYDSPHNLLPLCRECHNIAENNNWSVEKSNEYKIKWIKFCKKNYIKLKNYD